MTMNLIEDRGLFPDDCFEKLNYSDVRDDALRIYSCNEDVAKRNPNQNTRVKPNGRIIKNPWAIKVLARGKNPGSDQLLDWLVSSCYCHYCQQN